MKKTLTTIQTIYKIASIVSMVIFVCTIVGACMSLIGLSIYCTLGTEGLQIGGVNIKGLIDDLNNLSNEDVIYALASSTIICTTVAVVFRFIVTYLKKELVDGTPFTKRGAKELFRLGIIEIVLFFVTSIILEIVEVIINLNGKIVNAQLSDRPLSIWVGLMFIFLSIIYKYVAEKDEYSKNEEEKN